MGRLRGGELLLGRFSMDSSLDVGAAENERFTRLVHEVCAESAIVPPGDVRVIKTTHTKSGASSVRLGRFGRGYLRATHTLLEDLNDDELRVVIRHELAHYRHAEARWAPIQGAAFISPFLVYIYGYQLNSVVGKVATLSLYFLAVSAHILAFRSKRHFEARADRESIKHRKDGPDATNALLKVATRARRHAPGVPNDEGDQIIREFELELNAPATKTVRLFNVIWGTHPLLKQRLTMFEDIARRCE